MTVPRKTQKPTKSKRGRKGEGQPRKVQPCGCNSWWNDGEKKRHKNTCPHSRQAGPRSAAETARVKNIKTAQRMRASNRRKAQARIRAVRSFNWDAVQIMSTAGAKSLPGFAWVKLDSTCTVCGDETSANVDLRTLKIVVCDTCNIARQEGA